LAKKIAVGKEPVSCSAYVKARPSLHARDSAISTSTIPFDTNVDALKNVPPASQATVATATMLEFFEVATSTLILAKPR
jgi:hypothetical protein